MNSVINVPMTVMEATLLKSSCYIAAYELKDNDPLTAEQLTKLVNKINSILLKMDTSENEKLVDDINAKIAKEVDQL